PVIHKTPQVGAGSVPRSGTTPPVRIGLIGPGSFALRVLVPAFARAGARLELVGGGAGPSAESAQREFDFARLAPSAEALLADDDIDAVVIATRHSTHAELTIQALRAGKDVFCEKPPVLSRDDLEAALSAAVRTGRVLAVGFNRRFSSMLGELRDFVAEADGSLIACYRVSAGRLDADHWAHDVDEGGGRLLGEGCHFLDSL